MRKYEEFKELMNKKENAVGFMVREMFLAEETLKAAQSSWGRLVTENNAPAAGVAYEEVEKLKSEYLAACEKVEIVKAALEDARESETMKNIVDDVILEASLEIGDLQGKKNKIIQDLQENRRIQSAIMESLSILNERQEAILKEAKEVAFFKTRSKKNPAFKAIMNKLPTIGSLRVNLDKLPSPEKEQQRKEYQEKLLKRQTRINKANQKALESAQLQNDEKDAIIQANQAKLARK